MIQRQLQLLWTLSTRIGIDASKEVAGGVANSSSCSRGTAHSLSADTKVTSQNLFGIGNQLANRSANPSLQTIDFERLQPVRERSGQALEQRRPCKLNAACADHQFNLINTQLSQSFCRAKAAVANRYDICRRAGSQSSFSPPKTQNV